MNHQPSVSVPSMGTAGAHAEELASGERFDFGGNWARFLSVLDDDRIVAAERGLQELLGRTGSTERGFWTSDPGVDCPVSPPGDSVHACTRSTTIHSRSLARESCGDGSSPPIQTGRSSRDRCSIATRCESLGAFDVVYSWGVLHHTGRMWDALAHAAIPVAPEGKLAIAIYNDMGSQSRRWRSAEEDLQRAASSRAGAIRSRGHAPGRAEGVCRRRASAPAGRLRSFVD